METVAIEKQLENEVNKFYLDSLEFLQVNDLNGESDDYVHFYYHIRDLVNPHRHYTALDKLGPIVLYVFLKTQGIFTKGIDVRLLNKEEYISRLKAKVRSGYRMFLFDPLKPTTEEEIEAHKYELWET